MDGQTHGRMVNENRGQVEPNKRAPVQHHYLCIVRIKDWALNLRPYNNVHTYKVSRQNNSIDSPNYKSLVKGIRLGG